MTSKLQFEPRDPAFVDKVRESFAQQEFMATLGAEISDIQPGSVRIEMPYSERFTQQHQYMHAAAIAAIADSACGYAAFTLTPPGTDVLSIEYKVNLLAPARGDNFYAIARVVKSGRTITVCDADVYAVRDQGEKLVASLTATIMSLPSRDHSASRKSRSARCGLETRT